MLPIPKFFKYYFYIAGTTQHTLHGCWLHALRVADRALRTQAAHTGSLSRLQLFRLNAGCSLLAVAHCLFPLPLLFAVLLSVYSALRGVLPSRHPVGTTASYILSQSVCQTDGNNNTHGGHTARLLQHHCCRARLQQAAARNGCRCNCAQHCCSPLAAMYTCHCRPLFAQLVF